MTPSPTALTLRREDALARLKPLLEDPSIGKVGHNIKYDLIVLERAGIHLAGITLDTMVASYLTDPSRMRHNLEDVCLHYLKRKMIPIADLIGKGSKAISFDQVPIAALRLCRRRRHITWRLGAVFTPMLRARPSEALFIKWEFRSGFWRKWNRHRDRLGSLRGLRVEVESLYEP
jgi:DNA polymerase-1